MENKLRNQILIITAVWQRHDLTNIVLSYYGKLASKSEGKISLLAVGSEGVKSRNICERNGWQYIERSNSPLSHKWSALTEYAKDLDFDFLIIVGSDNLLSLSLIQYYDSIYSKDSDFMLGLKDLYFYMIGSSKSYHFKGYESVHSIGAGRCMSRKILEKCNWKPWGEHSINRGLDSRCSTVINWHRIKEKGIKMEQTKGFAIDIKDPKTSITPESRFINHSEESDNILKKNFLKQYIHIKRTFA